MTDVRESAAAQMDAWQRRDAEAFTAFYAPDVVLREHATGTTLTGAAAVAAHNLGWTQVFPDIAAVVERQFADGGLVGWQLIWNGTHEGPLPLPDGTVVPPTGRAVQVPAVLMTEWRDGRVVAQDHYFNAAAMLMQLGVLPAPAAAA